MTAEALTSPTPYQLLPRLSEDEYGALRTDIAESGIAVPVDVDENGVILDGHHRAWIAAELGVECPRRVVTGLTEQGKRNYARRVNALRRSLTAEQRREQVAQMRAEGQTQAKIAATLGVSAGTVHHDLDVLRTEDVSTEPPTIVDTLGRKQPAKKALLSCRLCGDAFTHPVWHCKGCDNHWPAGQKCTTCSEKTAVIDTETGEVLPPPDATTEPKARKKSPPRRPLPEQAKSAGWDLRKSVERLERIAGDDRFDGHKELMAAHLSGHLTHAIEVCHDLLARVDLPGEE